MHVVFGTGPIGLAVVDELKARGQKVRVVNRSGTVDGAGGVDVWGGDVSDAGFAKSAVEGASVVYQCLNPPYDKWGELFPPLQRSVIAAAASTGAKLIALENLYMYEHDSSRPITEDRPEQPQTNKGRIRKAMSDELRRAHAEGRVKMAIGRASNYFGPRGGAQSTLGDRVVPRMMRGKNVSSLGDPTLPHTHSYLPDIGKGLVTLGERDETLGGVWHLPNAEAVSTAELAKMMYDAAGTDGEMRKVPRPLLRTASWFNPMVRETIEMLYEYDEPFVVDSSKFSDAFGISATPLCDAAAATVEWYQRDQATISAPPPERSLS